MCRRWTIYGVAVAVIGGVLVIALPHSALWWTCAIVGTGLWVAWMGTWGSAKVRRQIERVRGTG
jgi:hypothetical protein